MNTLHDIQKRNQNRPNFLEAFIKNFLVLMNISLFFVLCLAIYAHFVPDHFQITLTPLGIVVFMVFGMILNMMMLFLLFLSKKFRSHPKLNA